MRVSLKNCPLRIKFKTAVLLIVFSPSPSAPPTHLVIIFPPFKFGSRIYNNNKGNNPLSSLLFCFSRKFYGGPRSQKGLNPLLFCTSSVIACEKSWYGCLNFSSFDAYYDFWCMGLLGLFKLSLGWVICTQEKSL